ncbi:glycosyltransferase [Cohnella endophytica]|uniref:Glycosyltransferase n=1 Tax=Cohnella endophytica TaxID=2419778 RepID=A0A494XGN7_9BACL|nr:glycosyltransferase [Cohnella endophytica]RKP47244.1 glycosyltransferase [Cohnella endophytica]
MFKISVIVPVYNMGGYLKNCLDSLLLQSLKEIEIICINDGSSDHSLEVLRQYSSAHSNIIVLDQENCGVAASRNRGIEMARGEFVAFMDADDFYPDLDVLECLYHSAIENNVQICGGSLSKYIGDQTITAFSQRDQNCVFQENKMMTFREYQFPYGFTRFIYHLGFLRKNQLSFPLYTYFEDPPFLAKALNLVGQFYAINKNVYSYRLGHKPNNLTLRKTSDYATGVLDLLALSREEGLARLHANSIAVLHDDLTPALYRHAVEWNSALQERIIQINRTIDVDLLHSEGIDGSEAYLLEGEYISNHVKQAIENEKTFVKKLQEYPSIIIYGAGRVGTLALEYIKGIQGSCVSCFAVTRGRDNPSNIYGIEVRSIHELTEVRENALVVVATYSYLHEEIQNTLSHLGFKHVLPIDYQELQLYGIH